MLNPLTNTELLLIEVLNYLRIDTQYFELNPITISLRGRVGTSAVMSAAFDRGYAEGMRNARLMGIEFKRSSSVMPQIIIDTKLIPQSIRPEQLDDPAIISLLEHIPGAIKRT